MTKIDLVNIHAADILDGNRTSVLGLTWSVILGYQVSMVIVNLIILNFALKGIRLHKILETDVNTENHKLIKEIAQSILSKYFKKLKKKHMHHNFPI